MSSTYFNYVKIFPEINTMSQLQQINSKNNKYDESFYTISEINDEEDHQMNQEKMLRILKKQDPIKYNWLMNNPAFKNVIISQKQQRYSLPAKFDPEKKINIISLIKKFLSLKDKTSFSVPVLLNEPISMLQKFAESFEYPHLMDLANQQEDSCLRLAYVMAFSYSCVSQLFNRGKKPFNPLLGETYEFIDEKNNLRTISEQVSHHPPMTANYAENDNYIIYETLNAGGPPKFLGNSLEFPPLKPRHIKLKKYNDVIMIQRPKQILVNLIFGETKIEFIGDSLYTNHTTGDTALLQFKEGAFRFDCEGTIYDKNKQPRYKLQGQKDKEMIITDIIQNTQKTIWTRVYDPKIRCQDNWYLTLHGLMVNNLSYENIFDLPINDTRFRPDQKLLEQGQHDLAEDEKNRIEKKQRDTRQENQQKNIEHVPLWFEKKLNLISNEEEYFYKGGYWEARQQKSFKKIPNIF